MSRTASCLELVCACLRRLVGPTGQAGVSQTSHCVYSGSAKAATHVNSKPVPWLLSFGLYTLANHLVIRLLIRGRGGGIRVIVRCGHNLSSMSVGFSFFSFACSYHFLDLGGYTLNDFLSPFTSICDGCPFFLSDLSMDTPNEAHDFMTVPCEVKGINKSYST